MTHAGDWCTICGRAGHVAASCPRAPWNHPERPRGLEMGAPRWPCDIPSRDVDHGPHFHAEDGRPAACGVRTSPLARAHF